MPKRERDCSAFDLLLARVKTGLEEDVYAARFLLLQHSSWSHCSDLSVVSFAGAC